jgi:hypothetical protein
MRQSRLVLPTALLIAALATFTVAAPAMGGAALRTSLSGANEVPPTASTATGSFSGRINLGKSELCYVLTVSGLDSDAVGAHIHLGLAGTNGPVVIPLLTPDATDTVSECKTVSRSLLLAILQEPENYYVNVHTQTYPGGAIRGQLG